LGIELLCAVQALGFLGAERSDLRRECSYRRGHRVIWNRTQDDVVAAIFGKYGFGAPSLTHCSGNGHLIPAGYRKPLCHGQS
jgi:hypothetical protein